MAFIVLIAVVTGIVWNHRLLWNVFNGTIADATTTLPAPASREATMLPAGLMQAKELFDQKEAVFIDAREPSVYALGHIQGAVSLPVAKVDSALQNFMNETPLDAILIVYCSGYGCHDSNNVAEKLQARGYDTIFLFEGGYPEWKNAGFPIEGADS